MNRETVAFGAPLAGLAVGAVVLITGIFLGGLTTVAVVGGLVMLASISLLAFSVSRTV